MLKVVNWRRKKYSELSTTYCRTNKSFVGRRILCHTAVATVIAIEYMPVVKVVASSLLAS